MSENVQITRHTDIPSGNGEYHRLICLTGDLKGQAYLFTGNRVVLGRSEKCDVKVQDIKSSREHAEIAKVGNDFVVTDLGSQNGIHVNDLKVQQHKLKDGDKIIIGKTVYKFQKLVVELGQNGQKNVEAEVKEKRGKKEAKKGKNPLIIFGAVAIGLFLMLTGGNDEKKGKAQGQNNYQLNEVGDEFNTAEMKRKLAEDKELKKKLNDIFQRGLREYREGNYFRALSEFDLALMLSPKDALADYYKKKTKEALDKEIESQFIKGKRDIESLKFSSAIVAYCSIIRLLYNYPEDDRYKDAEANLRELEGILGMEPNEIKCIKE